MADAPFNDAVDRVSVFQPFLCEKIQLGAAGIGEMVVFACAVVECLGIGFKIAVLLELFEDRIERRFLDRGDELDRLADLIAVGILLTYDRQDQAFDDR